VLRLNVGSMAPKLRTPAFDSTPAEGHKEMARTVLAALENNSL
jgi:hypothetical protein